MLLESLQEHYTRVGTIDTTPPTNFFVVFKYIKKKISTWHVAHCGSWTFSQNFSSLALPVWDKQCLEDSEQKDYSMKLINEWMSNEGNCRRAPARPGRLKKITLASWHMTSDTRIETFLGLWYVGGHTIIIFFWHAFIEWSSCAFQKYTTF